MYATLPVPPSRIRERLIAALELEHGTAYLLGLDLSVQYVNQAWARFARANGAPQLAGDWRCDGPITRFFHEGTRASPAAHFERVIALDEPWSYTYDCSNGEHHRKFNMRVSLTRSRDGLIVVHSRFVEVPASSGDALREIVREYTDVRGLLVQCPGCDRIHHPSESCWDCAPALSAGECAKVSHGICPTCDFQYYGQE